MKHLIKPVLVLAALLVAGTALTGCQSRAEDAVKETDNSWLFADTATGDEHDTELTFVDADGVSTEVFYLNGDTVTGCVTTITYESEEQADLMYGTFANGSYSDSLSQVRLDGCRVVLTYSPHYVEAAFNGYTRDRLMTEMGDNNWTLLAD